MKRLLLALLGFALLLLFSTKGWSAKPDKDRFCLAETEHSHSAVLGQCSEAYEAEYYEIALQEWETFAKDGNAGAQHNLGQIYRRGQGVPKNDKTAAKWYRLAADQGNAYAQNNLGVMYKDGKGVSRNYDTALKWYRLAADQENALAQHNLALMYKDGKGVPPTKRLR